MGLQRKYKVDFKVQNAFRHYKSCFLGPIVKKKRWKNVALVIKWDHLFKNWLNIYMCAAVFSLLWMESRGAVDAELKIEFLTSLVINTLNCQCAKAENHHVLYTHCIPKFFFTCFLPTTLIVSRDHVFFRRRCLHL